MVLLLCLALVGCGTDEDPRASLEGPDAFVRSPAEAMAGCTTVGARTIARVAARIYQESLHGRVAMQAAHRLQRSAALITAVQNDDPLAARQALIEAMKGQIVRASVLRDSHLLASVGDSAALAPVSVPLLDASRGKVGRVILSTQASKSFIDTVAQVTASEVALFHGHRQLVSSLAGQRVALSSIPASGPVSYRGVKYQASSFSATGFPKQPLRIALLTGSDTLACASTGAQTTADVLGAVGERLYRAEQSSHKVTRVIGLMERSHAFLRAVAQRDPFLTRQAIIGFFRNRSHVVRVRVTVGGRLLVDVGGSEVLAPVAGTLRLHGRVIGHFLTAIQDDAGYEKLAHEFTGAQVTMQVGSHQLSSTLPGDRAGTVATGRGSATYEGVRYSVYSFAGKAFPSGRLLISLLVPST